jgi:altronate dehydratase small subunit
MGKCIVMDRQDNVATVLNHISPGEEVLILDSQMNQIGTVKSATKIPFGHKISLASLGNDADIIKYGEVIGKSTSAIKVGAYVHIHNVISIEGSKKVINNYLM